MTYTAAFHLVAVSFSLRPHESSGTMGKSTSETDVVDKRSAMVLGISSTGLIRALIKAGIKSLISLAIDSLGEGITAGLFDSDNTKSGLARHTLHETHKAAWFLVAMSFSRRTTREK